MGRSIGVKGAVSTGTMGGYLCEVSTGKHFGLTNGHVCAMHIKSSLESLPMRMVGEGMEIFQNSDEDYGPTLESAKARYDLAVDSAAQYGGLGPRRNERELEAKKHYDEINGQKRLFGVVVRAEMSIWDSPHGEYRSWKDYGLILPVEGKALTILWLS